MSVSRHVTIILAASGLAVGAASCKSQNSNQPATQSPAGNELAAKGHQPENSANANSAVIAESKWKPAMDPKPLSDQVDKGLSWLIAHQLSNGGWGQGDEAPTMGQNPAMQKLANTANVADTSMAVMALMRAGSRANEGEYKQAIRRGLEYVISEIEESDDDSLYITDVRGTRVQMKIGTYVDTFTALTTLTEAKGTMPDDAGNKRLDNALAKILSKIEKNQRHDGTWDNQGWAPVLTQSIAAKGLNRAAQSGEDVDEETLKKVELQARAQFDAKSGSFAGGGSAGVGLYAGAANSSTLRDSTNTRKTKNRSLAIRAKSAPTAEARADAERELNENKQAEIATDTAEKALIKQLEDPRYIAGFGNNGGEEFLSYMLVSESLVVKGGDDWNRWDAAITKLVNKVQNDDGSWTGHHCITGRTFVTSAALMVLMADRTPVPVAAKLAERHN